MQTKAVVQMSGAGPARRDLKVQGMRSGFEARVGVPGDKSISHRAVLLGAIGDGETRVRGFGRSADTEATVAAARALGVSVDEVAHDELLVHGAGLRGLRAGTVDCANAGTVMRRRA